MATQLYDSRGPNTVQRKADGYTLVDLGVTQTLAGRYDIVIMRPICSISYTIGRTRCRVRDARRCSAWVPA